jgi:hypothetical protein
MASFLTRTPNYGRDFDRHLGLSGLLQVFYLKEVLAPFAVVCVHPCSFFRYFEVRAGLVRANRTGFLDEAAFRNATGVRHPSAPARTRKSPEYSELPRLLQ